MSKFSEKFVAWCKETQKWITDNLEQDKLLHFTFAAVITKILAFFAPLWIAIPVVLLIIAGKEFFDWKTGGEFNWKDIVAGLLGMFVGL